MNAQHHPISVLTSLARGELDEYTGERRVVAVRSIPVGHTIAVFGGAPLTYQALVCAGGRGIIEPDVARVTLQVDEDEYLMSTQVSPADWINHSCDPNAWFRGNVALVAQRRVRAGEEICFDYATSDGSAYDEFDCRCGSAWCRGRVSGDDWRRPELWARYHGHFSPYLARRIARLQAVQSASRVTGPESRP